MALELKQSVKLAQQLVVTPQLQQAIKLLALSRLELAGLIQAELLENPVLEDGDGSADEQDEEKKSNAEEHEQAKDDDRGHEHLTDEVGTAEGKLPEPANFDWENYMETFSEPGYTGERERASDEAPAYENVISQTESLHDHLFWQLHLMTISEAEQAIASEIIGNINDDGYLLATVEEISVKTGFPPADTERALKLIQGLDPVGVAARDLKECLLLQIAKIGDPGGYMARIVGDHLPDLERRNYSHIANELCIEPSKAKELAHVISMLEPKPGRPYGGEAPQYIVPDVYVQKVGENYVITLNEDGLPRLRVSQFYRRALMRGSQVAGETKEYIQDRMRSAMWLIRSIHQRQRTLYRVASSIVKFQRDFLDKGISDLKPLVLKNVADDIEMHESTISRVTTNKFMHTPRGIFELKFFFNSGIHQLEGGGVASEAVKTAIKKLIEGEDAKYPLSDQDITDKLKAFNIDIARRTVAKYRETMGILPSSRRKRME